MRHATCAYQKHGFVKYKGIWGIYHVYRRFTSQSKFVQIHLFDQ